MMNPLLWPGVLLAVVLVLAVVGLRVVAGWIREQRAIPAEVRAELADLPMSPLQRRAWIALAIVSLAMLACFAIVSGAGGAQVYWDDDSVRLPVTGIFITALLVHTLVLYLPMRSGSSTFDERDRRILTHSPAFQSAAMLVAMAAWMIYLTESFRPERLIPSVYLYLIFGTMIMVQMIATDLGILFGYWSGLGDAES